MSDNDRTPEILDKLHEIQLEARSANHALHTELTERCTSLESTVGRGCRQLDEAAAALKAHAELDDSRDRAIRDKLAEIEKREAVRSALEAHEAKRAGARSGAFWAAVVSVPIAVIGWAVSAWTKP